MTPPSVEKELINILDEYLAQYRKWHIREPNLMDLLKWLKQGQVPKKGKR